uniref:Uncharacterized protein n=1 Tax=Arundo donax TaxID=35708 RepID=A0A0A9BIK7_ARUDO
MVLATLLVMVICFCCPLLNPRFYPKTMMRFSPWQLTLLHMSIYVRAFM